MLYWTDFDLGTVDSYDTISGFTRRVLQLTGHPIGVAVDSNYLYISMKDSRQVSK